MMKRVMVVFLFVLTSIFIFADTSDIFVKYISSLAGKNNIKLSISGKFAISTIYDIKFDLYVYKSRYFVVQVKKPALFQGISYVYDVYSSKLYTQGDNFVDSYQDIPVLATTIPTVAMTLFIPYDPKNFDVTEEVTGNYLYYNLLPKSAKASQIAGAFSDILGNKSPDDKKTVKSNEYMKFRITLFSPVKGVHILNSVELLNNTEKKYIKFKIDSLTFPEDEKIGEYIKEILNKNNKSISSQ